MKVFAKAANTRIFILLLQLSMPADKATNVNIDANVMCPSVSPFHHLALAIILTFFIFS